MAMLENQQGWVPFEDNRECSQRLCTLYCPQWCYVLFPPPPFSIEDDDSSNTSFSPLAIAIIGILATAFILISYYTVVAKYCGGSSYRHHRRHSDNRPEEEESAGNPHNRESWHLAPSEGLDEALIRRIEVCKYRLGEGLGTDCSVCLAEFRENESLRLLPKCSHAFHLHCIDVWLKSHSNCPLCRTNIVLQSSDLENSAPPGSDHEQETLVIVIEGPDLEGSGVETDDDEEEEEKDFEGGSDGNLFKDFEVNEIGEEDGKLSGHSFSLGSACKGRVFSISDVMKVILEEEYMVDGGGGSTKRGVGGGGGEKSKLIKGRRSRGLHRVMRPVRMKRSVSIGRSSFARKGKPVKKMVFGRAAEDR